jgi:hypothetical protein
LATTIPSVTGSVLCPQPRRILYHLDVYLVQHSEALPEEQDPQRPLIVPGLYQLRIQLRRSAVVKVGDLGKSHFLSGCYVYTGSAHTA